MGSEGPSGLRRDRAPTRFSVGTLRIAVVKPDWGIRGGFELVVDRLISHLQKSRHQVSVLTFDAAHTDHRPFGHRVSPEIWASTPLFFNYIAQIESSRAVQAGRADVVISTQPPSFLVEHPRHLSIFYHHIRPFYELGEYFVRANLVEPEMHAIATEAVRKIDDRALRQVSHIMAGSESVAERLALYNNRTAGMSVFHAGPSIERPIEGGRAGASKHVLCVSRHDFPKRTELFVHAARLAPELTSVSVGTGGRLGIVRTIDQRFSEDGVPPVIADTDLWLTNHPWIDPSSVTTQASNLRVAGSVSDDELDCLYRDALCVVAPALLEDYGLTVIEAMGYGKPVIVCNDGGHLCHFVQDGVNGLVVEPTGAAIAAAMRRLASDPQLATQLGEGARETAAAFTWERALTEFDLALDEVMS